MSGECNVLETYILFHFWGHLGRHLFVGLRKISTELDAARELTRVGDEEYGCSGDPCCDCSVHQYGQIVLLWQGS